MLISKIQSQIQYRFRVEPGMTLTGTFFCLILCITAIRPTPVIASSFDLSIQPPLSQITIKPGKSVTQAFTIKNLSDHNQVVTTSLVPFTGSDNGIPILNFDSSPSWLSMFSLVNANIKLNEPFTIPAGGTEQIVLHIRIPQTAPLEDYYVVLLASEGDSDSLTTGTSLSGAIGSNLLISVSNTENPISEISISSFLPQGHLFTIKDTYIVDNLSSLTFSSKVQNKGAQLASIEGNFVVTLAGRSNNTQLIKPAFVLGYGNRILEASSSGTTTLEFKPNLTSVGFGHATLTLNQPGNQIQQKISLFVFPFKALLALGTTLIFLSTIIKLSSNNKQ